MNVVFAACTGALLILTAQQLLRYRYTMNSSLSHCPLTLLIYWTVIFTEFTTFIMMILEAVDRFQGKQSINNSVSFDIFTGFGLLIIGIWQALSMIILTCKLNAKYDLLSGKSVEEVSNHDVTLRRWFKSS